MAVPKPGSHLTVGAGLEVRSHCLLIERYPHTQPCRANFGTQTETRQEINSMCNITVFTESTSVWKSDRRKSGLN